MVNAGLRLPWVVIHRPVHADSSDVQITPDLPDELDTDAVPGNVALRQRLPVPDQPNAGQSPETRNGGVRAHSAHNMADFRRAIAGPVQIPCWPSPSHGFSICWRAIAKSRGSARVNTSSINRASSR